MCVRVICLMCFCVCACAVLPGVFVNMCDCGVDVLLMCLCAVCADCVMLYGVLLLEWRLCL